MKEYVHNSNSISDNIINNHVKRARAVIINSNNELLLGYENNYEFIGGHLDEGEDYKGALKREVKEESGIDIYTDNLNPFYKIYYYTKDYPKNGINTKYSIYYYLIKTDLKPNLNNINLTKNEIKNNFTLKYVKLDKVVNILEENLKVTKNKNAVKDTLMVLKELF